MSDKVDKEDLDKVRKGLNALLKNQRGLAKDIPMDYANLTRFLKGDKGLARENYEKCRTFLEAELKRLIQLIKEI